MYLHITRLQCFPGCLTIQIRTALCIVIVLLIYAVAQACVVGCMPRFWGVADGNSSILIIDVDGGANRTMEELPCDGARYALLSCVVGTLTLALFLRVSWLPKMPTHSFIFHPLKQHMCSLVPNQKPERTIGGSFHIRGYEPILSLLLFVSALALHSRQLDLKLRLDFLWAVQVRECVCVCVCIQCGCHDVRRVLPLQPRCTSTRMEGFVFVGRRLSGLWQTRG
ncbi:Adenylate cyclase type 1 [Liparis tanakae]|uniref:Adenylate cyclase type 1 n=1 Tax=Liparis tanakae TaxID=230148 RepID=A0A4Z2EFY4_9TELE|nr:Adenylate cyclase type 1 [Liparis tanakae]